MDPDLADAHVDPRSRRVNSIALTLSSGFPSLLLGLPPSSGCKDNAQSTLRFEQYDFGS